MQGWGGGEDELRVTANGDRVSFWGDGDILESGDGLHNIVNVQMKLKDAYYLEGKL